VFLKSSMREKCFLEWNYYKESFECTHTDRQNFVYIRKYTLKKKEIYRLCIFRISTFGLNKRLILWINVSFSRNIHTLKPINTPFNLPKSDVYKILNIRKKVLNIRGSVWSIHTEKTQYTHHFYLPMTECRLKYTQSNTVNKHW
jgi:hypothetical protein